MTYDNPWKYDNKLFDSDSISGHVGFVYLIENTLTGQKYIGQKKFFAPKYKMVNKKRKKSFIESDWKDYYGSNKELQIDVSRFGIEYFKRKIIRLCLGKGEMNYYELREQILRDVLLRDDYYNSYVGSRIHRKHLRNAKAL